MNPVRRYLGYWRYDPIAAALDTLIAALLTVCAVKYGLA